VRHRSMVGGLRCLVFRVVLSCVVVFCRVIVAVVVVVVVVAGGVAVAVGIAVDGCGRRWMVLASFSIGIGDDGANCQQTASKCDPVPRPSWSSAIGAVRQQPSTGKAVTDDPGATLEMLELQGQPRICAAP